jgi:competence protein ComFC
MNLAGSKRPAYFLYQSIWVVLDWLYPPNCAGCGQAGVRWCEACQLNLAPLRAPLCPVCGEHRSNAQLCPDCQGDPPEYEMLRSYAIHAGPIRHALHRLKYQRDIGIAESLSKHLIELYNHFKWDIDIVVPVPLSAKRKQERGYNQAGLLGRPLAYAIQKPYRSDILWRSRETRSQVGLSAQDRLQNVKNAFSAHTNSVKDKTILIVDDVTTTGSTINACAQALRLAGASAIYGLTVARAESKRDTEDPPTTSYPNGG